MEVRFLRHGETEWNREKRIQGSTEWTEGAESFDDVAARVKDFFDKELVPASERISRVMVVAHGGVLRTVLRLVAAIPLEDFWKCSQPNCCAHIVEIANGRTFLKARAHLA